VAGSAERFDFFARLPQPSFPGGTLLRWPGLVAGMLYYSLRDKLSRAGGAQAACCRPTIAIWPLFSTCEPVDSPAESGPLS
jgi:hypothetical protein